jgi:hypothetical protein
MNSTHTAVGIGSGGAVGILTGIIAGTWHLDPNLAADWAMALVGAAGFAGGMVIWFIKWKYPTAPALPGELVDIPAGAPPATLAVVPAAPPPPAPAPPPVPPPPPAPQPQGAPQ